MPVCRYGSPLPWAVHTFAALLLLGANLPAAALSLGDYEVRSTLGEPLRLELAIESDRSAGGMPAARLIDANGSETWTAAGVAPGGIRMEVVAIDDIHQRLLIRSTLPVWEPLITLRVEVTQASMRVVRELPILLDPPSAQGAAGQDIEWTDERSQQIGVIDASAALHMPSTVSGIDPQIVEERRTRPRNIPRASTPSSPRTAEAPVPRFQLAAVLSSDSLAWLEVNPEPGVGEAVVETVSPEPVSTISEEPAETDAGIAEPPRPVERTPAATSTAYPRGLPMGSPWRVFFFMAALATALFAYARRLRLRMMVQDGFPA